MRHTNFADLVASLRAAPTRRDALTALIGGLAATVAVHGGNGPRPEAEARSCTQQCKKKKTARQRRKCRQKCDRPQPPKCDVCRSGCALTSIQDAIDEAASGDTIRICAGIYAEQLEIAKDVTLIGAGDGEGGTTLDGEDVITGLVHIRDATVQLEGLRIRGAVGALGGGISSQRSTLTLRRCTVSGHNAAAGGGIFVEDGDLTLENSVVAGNRIGLIGGAIYFDSEDGALTLTNCRVEGNQAGKEGGGIALVAGRSRSSTARSRATQRGAVVASTVSPAPPRCKTAW